MPDYCCPMDDFRIAAPTMAAEMRPAVTDSVVPVESRAIRKLFRARSRVGGSGVSSNSEPDHGSAKPVLSVRIFRVSQESCRVDSGHMLCVEVAISKSTTIRREPNAREITRAAFVRSCSRLPTLLAHPLKDARAVVIHALGPSLQGIRQNCGEPCRLLSAHIPGLGPVLLSPPRLLTINTRAPFDHVEIDLQNAPLAEGEFGHRYQCELRTLAEDRAARS